MRQRLAFHATDVLTVGRQVVALWPEDDPEGEFNPMCSAVPPEAMLNPAILSRRIKQHASEAPSVSTIPAVDTPPHDTFLAPGRNYPPPDAVSPTSTPVATNLEGECRQENDDDGRPTSHYDPSIPEKQVHLQICLEIANGHGLPSPEQMLETPRPGRDVIDYHNSGNFMTILGELIGNHRARRLTRIVINDAPPMYDDSLEMPLSGAPNSEVAALGAADLDYLLHKGVFRLPPKPIW